MTDIVEKLWGFCHTLHHDGIEQLTHLWFINMGRRYGEVAHA